jgi:alpha-beta hydrolase superfamily lysophospholipase
MIAQYLHYNSFQARNLSSAILMVSPYRIRFESILKPVHGILNLILSLAQMISMGRPFFQFKPDFRPSYYFEYHKLDQIDLIRSPKTTARHFRNVLKLIQDLPKLIPEINIPLFVLEGTQDQMLDPMGSVELAHQAKKVYRKVHLFKGADHSLFFDKNAQNVYNMILNWILGDYKVKKKK